MELQIDLMQSLASHLVDLGNKIAILEDKLTERGLEKPCPCSPIIEKLSTLPVILSFLVNSIREPKRDI